jgi:hypothetical protein
LTVCCFAPESFEGDARSARQGAARAKVLTVPRWPARDASATIAPRCRNLPTGSLDFHLQPLTGTMPSRRARAVE